MTDQLTPNEAFAYRVPVTDPRWATVECDYRGAKQREYDALSDQEKLVYEVAACEPGTEYSASLGLETVTHDQAMGSALRYRLTL